MKVLLATAILAAVAFGLVYGQEVEDPCDNPGENECLRTWCNIDYVVNSCAEECADGEINYDVSCWPIYYF